MSNPKLCKNCKHYLYFSGFQLCRHPNVVKFSEIDGKKHDVACYNARSGYHGKCGADAKLWEERTSGQTFQDTYEMPIFVIVVFAFIIFISFFVA